MQKSKVGEEEDHVSLAANFDEYQAGYHVDQTTKHQMQINLDKYNLQAYHLFNGTMAAYNKLNEMSFGRQFQKMVFQ